MEQPKRKLKEKSKTQQPNPPLQQIEFISPLQPEQCVQLLRQRHDWSVLAALSQRICVDVSQLDHDTYEFKVERVSGREVVAQVIGDLRRWDGTSTLDTGDSHISEEMFARWAFLLISIVGIPIVVLNYYLAERARRELIGIIQTTVGVDV